MVTCDNTVVLSPAIMVDGATVEENNQGATQNLYPTLSEDTSLLTIPQTGFNGTKSHPLTDTSERKSKLDINIGGSDDNLDDQPNEEDVVVLPPDGGWGWVVVLASFLCNVMVDGIIFTSGMLFTPIMEEFGVSYSMVSWVSSLIGGFYLLAGPFVSSLANAFGFRFVCIVGALMAACSCVISYFATGIVYLYFSYGILAGIGFGFIYVPAVIATGFYFDKRRALATGLAVCGSGIGTFTLAPLNSYIIEKLDWRNALLTYAGMILSCGIYGLAFRPLSPSTGKVIYRDEDEQPTDLLHKIKMQRDLDLKNCKSEQSIELNTMNNNVEDIPTRPSENFLAVPSAGLISRKGSSVSLRSESMRPFYRQDAFFTGSMSRLPQYSRSNTQEGYLASVTHIPESVLEDELTGEEKKCCGVFPAATTTVLSKMFDFSLCKSPTFIILSLAGFLSLLSLFVPFNFLPSFIVSNKENMGLTEDEAKETAAFIMSLIGICNTFGRIMAGYISDRPSVDAILVNNIALIIGGAATILLPFITNVSLLYLYGLLFGLSVAFFASLRSILLVELLGLEKLTNAFGLLLLIQGIAALFGSPIAGGFADVTGDFSISFYVFGSIYALSGIICIPLRKIKSWEDRRNEKRSPANL